MCFTIVGAVAPKQQTGIAAAGKGIRKDEPVRQ
ncbi:hypothetical protein L1278_000889 [Pontibacter sp. HSC-36F09]|nr:hypothetical protein [Pontibacter sp. HSC-36F09]